MNTASWILIGSLTAVGLWACNGDQGAAGTPSADPATTAATSTSTTTTSSETAAPETTAEETTDSPDTSASVKTGDTPPVNPTASSSAGPESKYDCGGKGQKACPMQGWMKGVMARAIASGDKDKIAAALNTIASKPVAGFDSWAAIAADGAAKAAGGDIEGAKNSCKKCHGLYQKKYIATMRDRPW